MHLILEQTQQNCLVVETGLMESVATNICTKEITHHPHMMAPIMYVSTLLLVVTVVLLFV